jgi:branched-chain amino acid transport system substrate-binding protein
MIARWPVFLLGPLLAVPIGAASATPADSVRDLAARVGPLVGQASTCQTIAQGRVQVIVDQFREAIRQASSNDAERDLLTRGFNSYIADGRSRMTALQLDCQSTDRQLAELERSLNLPVASSATSTPAPSPVAAAAQPAGPISSEPVHGVTDKEIRFGIVIPFSGIRKEPGRQMKMGIEAAFDQANDAGGVNGRMLKLFAADDQYDPNRTVAAMTQLYEKDQVMGFIGNLGTANSVAGIPYALEHRALFFAPYGGATVVRRDPPDRYVFNYRASDAEEIAAIVRYLVKVRRLSPRQIVTFAQQDAYGDDGVAGVARAFRAIGYNDAIPRYSFPRGTLDVDDDVRRLQLQKPPAKAVIMIATDRAAAKFIEKAHDLVPDLIYANVSTVGSTSLAEELKLLGPRYTDGVIVTQGVPAVSGYSSLVLNYKNALNKFFPGEEVDYTSLEGYVSASILIRGLQQTNPLTTERLVDALESMQKFDLGIGATLSFGRAEHQASHKIWGTALDENGVYQAIDLE